MHWNQAANQIARANHLSISESNRLLAVLNLAMADTAFTIWSAKRHYGLVSSEVTWRPVTAIRLADADGNPEHGRRRGLAAARQHAVPPRVSRRPSESEWGGGDRTPQPLRR